ncbi:hypothetical protein [Streptomyces sp. HNM0574]|uniref:hypothetical protein n=1 Tax=Streptomyces sp. HNM0574 TaxID=2714954 RepID=UPI00146D6E74|nr:hypothetical protein [Streptomyces sp. HNM0574]NLU68114.1 hypothetical protein [Streptomyces sp. HNM0574]
MRHRRGITRALVTGIVLLLSLVALTGSSTARMLPPEERAEITAERSVSGHPEKKTSVSLMEDCRTRRGARQAGNGVAPQLHLVRVIDCSLRAERKGMPVMSLLGRDAVPASPRSVELPVMHQVFRC